MSTVVESTAAEVLIETIERFVEAARQRSEVDPDQRRRAERRYHRSWPLGVSFNQSEFSAALYNASPQGLAFLSTLPIPPDSLVFVQLFCHDPFSPRVPAVVRHATNTPHGFLVGCEFTLGDEELCRQALEHGQVAEVGV